MIKPKNLWLLPILKGIVGGAAFIIVASFLVSFVLPAWAVSFPIGGGYVIDLGALTPWIGIAVTLGIWWDARKAKKNAADAAAKAAAGVAEIKAVAVQIDGLLAERDKAKVIEGEAKGEKKGADAALQLAEGLRQGIEMERASVAAKTAGGTPNNTHAGPLPVADDRTATASERVAEATERSAGAGERVASAAEDSASKTKS